MSSSKDTQLSPRNSVKRPVNTRHFQQFEGVFNSNVDMLQFNLKSSLNLVLKTT